MTTSASDKKQVKGPVVGSSLAFGGGMALGFLLIYLLLISPLVSWLVDLLVGQQPFVKIIVGLLIYLFIIGLGGAAAGAWGGLAISRYSQATTEKRFLRRGALSFFIAHLLVIIPAIALIFIVSTFNPDIDVSSSKLPRLILLVGLFYGLVSGLLFGLLMAGLRRILGVVLVAAAGFGLGGFSMGHFFLETILDQDEWTDPAIVARPSAAVEPRLGRDTDGTLFLAWRDGGDPQVLSMTPYSCDERPVGNIS